MPNLELHALFHGRVQGIGFRWTVVDCAERFHLKGTVKNLSNGTVEVFAQGSKESLTKFLEAIGEDAGMARIESVKSEFNEPEKKYSDFRIIY